MAVTLTSARGRGEKKVSRPAPKRQVQKVPACRAPRPGQRCPGCQKGRLDYDGLLNLSCPTCGYSAGGGSFT